MRVQCCIQAVLCNQCGVVAVFDDAPLLNNQNTVCTPYRSQSMGDDDACSAVEQSFKCLLDEGFGGCVDTTGGFVQNQNTMRL